MRDFIPVDTARRRFVVDLIISVARRRGFQEVQAPSLEKIERLKSDQGGENESMIFEVIKRGLDQNVPVLPRQVVDLGLRYDLTLPLTRFYASNKSSLPRVFKSFQTGNVWRAERPQKGRFREFTQFDLDIIGEKSITAEIELISAGLQILIDLNLENSSTLLVNDRRILRDIMLRARIDIDDHSSTLIILDKIDKIGRSGVEKELKELRGLTSVQVEELFDLIERMERDSDCFQSSEWEWYDIPYLIASLRKIYPDFKVSFSPTLVRGMGYYTGPIYEVVNDFSNKSICGGGRYDDMISKWSGDSVPAVGFSFGFERIMDLLPESWHISNGEHLAIGYSSINQFQEAITLQKHLLEAGISEVSLVKKPKKIKAVFFEDLSRQACDRFFDMDDFAPSLLKDKRYIIEVSRPILRQA
ncbi:ATP phosphoribosyltransferase regulatory subunit [Corynebacterium felinum]|nr:ATP phosphoribosyltransferase regulatory subunit [Corynebacterium felinum]MDF5820358.1 ATP phosphoribosyltransferase regulatory subunit [Corynebacterium felinum]WJY93800.1 Histidine--tRNA ligase [Corynebacterium felinum]